MLPKPGRQLFAVLMVFFGFILLSCGTLTTVQTTIPTYPSHPLVPIPEKVVIANAFDIKSKPFRDSKEEEFKLLIEGAMTHAEQQIKEHSRADAEAMKNDVVPVTGSDSVRAVIRSAGATHGMFITFFNAFFEQTQVEVTKTDEGKSREAFYDIVVEMKYSLRDMEGLSFDTLISVRKFHSSRSVLSGLLAAGPNIVSNRDDALNGVFFNVDQYLKNFFPGQENRSRNLFLTKEFKNIGEAIRQSNYQEAFETSEKLTASSDKKMSAMAYYICAVLAEREGNFESAKSYLMESLNRQQNVEVQSMLADYRHMPLKGQ